MTEEELAEEANALTRAARALGKAWHRRAVDFAIEAGFTKEDAERLIAESVMIRFLESRS